MEVLFDPHPIPPSDEGGRVKKGEKMKTEKETKQDELAAIGIGAMIVFIALILVAAVAAAVIIQTAEKLQQNAQASGDDTQEQMSTKVILLSTVIDDMTGGAEELFSTFELAPGSEPIQADDLAYTVICDDGAGSAAFDDGDFELVQQNTTIYTMAMVTRPQPSHHVESRNNLRCCSRYSNVRTNCKHRPHPCDLCRWWRFHIRRTPIR